MLVIYISAGCGADNAACSSEALKQQAIGFFKVCTCSRIKCRLLRPIGSLVQFTAACIAPECIWCRTVFFFKGAVKVGGGFISD